MNEKDEAEADEELARRLVKVIEANSESTLKDKEVIKKGDHVQKEDEYNFKKESSMITE